MLDDKSLTMQWQGITYLNNLYGRCPKRYKLCFVPDRIANHSTRNTHVANKTGRSPTFQDPGTPLDRLMGTKVHASSIEMVLSFKTRTYGKVLGSPRRVLWCGLVPTSLTRTRRHSDTRVPLNSSSGKVLPVPPCMKSLATNRRQKRCRKSQVGV